MSSINPNARSSVELMGKMLNIFENLQTIMVLIAAGFMLSSSAKIMFGAHLFDQRAFAAEFKFISPSKGLTFADS